MVPLRLLARRLELRRRRSCCLCRGCFLLARWGWLEDWVESCRSLAHCRGRGPCAAVGHLPGFSPRLHDQHQHPPLCCRGFLLHLFRHRPPPRFRQHEQGRFCVFCVVGNFACNFKTHAPCDTLGTRYGAKKRFGCLHEKKKKPKLVSHTPPSNERLVEHCAEPCNIFQGLGVGSGKCSSDSCASFFQWRGPSQPSTTT